MEETLQAPAGIRGAGWLTVAIVAVATTTVGCNRGEPDVCPGKGDAELPGVAVCGDAFDLNEAPAPGRFAVRVDAFVHVDVGGILSSETMTSMVLLATIDHDPTTRDASMTLEICDIEIPPVDVPGQANPTTFEILPELIPNLDPIGGRGRTSSNQTCADFSADPATVIIGARLSDLLAELPQDASTMACADATDIDCITDVDGDGKPGATLLAANVPGLDITEAHAVLRSQVTMHGFVGSSFKIFGNATFAIEQAVVGCRIRPADGIERGCNATELGILRTLNPVITQSAELDTTFLGIRVPRGSDCTWLAAEQNNVFGR